MERTNLKKLILFCLPIVFAVSLAITLAACMAQAGKSLTDGAFDDPDADTSSPPSSDVSADGPSYSVGLTYVSRGDGTCIVAGIGSCTDSEVIIPEKNPSGERVTAIGESAFMGCEDLNSVCLPLGLTDIGAYAFYTSSIKRIEIPSSVERIGSCAFVNCYLLTAIDVDGENSAYTSIDGVLFSKDKSVLICYPSGKTDANYTIRLGVGSIGNAAFLNCAHLKSVSFNGSAAQWSTVKIGANNGSLTSLKITFAKNDSK